MEKTTARLRKTFHYPADEDSDDSLPEVLDEEEQDNLIHTLHQENITRNKQYATALLAISIFCILPYLRTLFSPATSLLSLLSITSLLSTAYLLYFLPPSKTGILILDDLNRPPAPKSKSRTYVPSYDVDSGPIERYLPLLNLGLCTLLVLAARVLRGRDEIWTGFGIVPGVVFLVVLVSKVVMGSVDPEEELGELRYRFKGA